MDKLDQIKPVLQVELVHVLLIIWMLDIFPLLRNAVGFYPLTMYVVALVAKLPCPKTHQPQIVVLFELLTKGFEKIIMIGVYFVLLVKNKVYFTNKKNCFGSGTC